MKHIFIVLMLLCSGLTTAIAQNDSFYLEKVKKATEQADYETALQTLSEGLEKNPNSVEMLYQAANCNYRLKNYEKAIAYAEKTIRRDSNKIEAYRLIGNSYDLSGEYQKAVDYFLLHTARFPYEGELYFDLGVIEYLRNDFKQAVYYWEKGIGAEPYFADNYYWASKLYAKSNEKLYALIYAETFLNIEKNTERTEEVAQLLRDTYVNFFKEEIEGFSMVDIFFDRSDEKNKFYEASRRVIQQMKDNEIIRPILMNPKVLDGGQESYSRHISGFRKEFVYLWTQMFPNIKMPLYTWQSKMNDSGYIQPYTYWLLMSAEPQFFVEWQMKSYSSYSNFLEWYNRNPLRVNAINRFCRLDYVEKIPQIPPSTPILQKSQVEDSTKEIQKVD